MALPLLSIPLLPSHLHPPVIQVVHHHVPLHLVLENPADPRVPFHKQVLCPPKGWHSDVVGHRPAMAQVGAETR